MNSTAAEGYGDARAHDLRRRYHALYDGRELPVPVEAIAEDLLALHVERAPLDGISGVLYPAARRIVVAADDVPARQRFTLAHEVGHWVCQCRTGRHPPVLCRTEDMSLDPATRSREREANIFAAELLMPEEAVRSIAAEEAAQALGVSELALAWRRYSFDLGPRPVR